MAAKKTKKKAASKKPAPSKTGKKKAAAKKKAPASKKKTSGKSTAKSGGKTKKAAVKKKPAAKKVSKAKPARKKPAAKKKPVAKKKATVKKKAAVKASKAPAAKKIAPKKKTTSQKKKNGSSGPTHAFVPTTVDELLGRPSRKIQKSNRKSKPLTKKELQKFRELLLELRDRVIDEISFISNDNLNRSSKESSGDLSGYSFHMADQGTDNYDREFAASLLNTEHDVLYEIDEALRRIDQGTYGICEISGHTIERERLKVLPFARFSVAVQSEIEKGKPRSNPMRHSGIQGPEYSI